MENSSPSSQIRERSFSIDLIAARPGEFYGIGQTIDRRSGHAKKSAHRASACLIIPTASWQESLRAIEISLLKPLVQKPDSSTHPKNALFGLSGISRSPMFPVP